MIFKVQDKIKGNDFGYDMNKVKSINKRCFMCHETHYTVECPQYKSSTITQRFELAHSKNICQNCMITDNHQHTNCNLKGACCYNLKGGRKCNGYHHITLHTRNFRPSSPIHSNPSTRNNSPSNQKDTVEIITESTQEAECSDSEMISGMKSTISHGKGTSRNQRKYQSIPIDNHTTYQINTVLASISNTKKTIKMFKVDFIKNDGKFKYIDYAVGDSAAEVTLIDEELADLLGATGPVINLETTWTDGTKREEKSKIVSITLRSRHTNKYITLEKCYTTRNLELPPRSLDMDELKKKYPYLKNVEFDSYFDVQPSMLIGTYHASLIENQRKLISKGIGFPVAINARIGISVYGGNTDSAVRTHINGCIVRKDKLISIENSNKSLPTNKSTHEKN